MLIYIFDNQENKLKFNEVLGLREIENNLCIVIDGYIDMIIYLVK
jgi:hypothetical protein